MAKSNCHALWYISTSVMVLYKGIVTQYIYARSASIRNASRLWYQLHAAFHT